MKNEIDFKELDQMYSFCLTGGHGPDLILTNVETVRQCFFLSKDYRSWHSFRKREVESGFLYLNPQRLPL